MNGLLGQIAWKLCLIAAVQDDRGRFLALITHPFLVSFPQCVSFGDALKTCSTFRLSARSIPIRDSMSQSPRRGSSARLLLPFVDLLFGFWQLGDEVRGVPQRYQLAAVGQDDRIFKWCGPAANGASTSCRIGS
jgi:hypothetical protein